MALGDIDPSSTVAFRVTIDGIALSQVTEVSGLKVEVDKIELKQQTEDGKFVVRQLIGRPKAGELTITRGLTASTSMTDWLNVVMQGDVPGARKTVAVALHDLEGQPLASYSFLNCWVRSVAIENLTAGAVGPASETSVICYDEAVRL